MVVKHLELLEMSVLIWVLFLDGLSWQKNGEHIPHSSRQNNREHIPHLDHLLRSVIVFPRLLSTFLYVSRFERGFLSHTVFDGE